MHEAQISDAPLRTWEIWRLQQEIPGSR